MIHDLPVNEADGDKKKSSNGEACSSPLPTSTLFLFPLRGVPGYLRDWTGVPAGREDCWGGNERLVNAYCFNTRIAFNLWGVICTHHMLQCLPRRTCNYPDRERALTGTRRKSASSNRVCCPRSLARDATGLAAVDMRDQIPAPAPCSAHRQ